MFTEKQKGELKDVFDGVEPKVSMIKIPDVGYIPDPTHPGHDYFSDPEPSMVGKILAKLGL